MSTVIAKLKLSNYHLSPLINFLNEPLPALLAVPRNKLILLFGEKLTALNDSRDVLLKKWGDLDEHGELQVDMNSGTYKLTDKDKFTEEYDALQQTEITFDVIPANKAHFLALKNILVNFEKKLDVQETTLYAEILEAVEKLDI